MIQVLIISYNRRKALKKLLSDFDAQKTRKKFAVHVYLDEPKKISFKPEKYKLTQSNQAHEGKVGFWKTITRAWSDIRDKKTKYFIQLPDDVRVNESFIDDVVSKFDSLPNGTACLNLRMDKARIGKRCWTKTIPTIEKHGSDLFFRTGWVDGCFVAKQSFFKALGWKVDPINPQRWARSSRMSSGVGMQISLRLHNLGLKMFQVRNPVLTEAHLPSQMNEEANRNVSKEEYDLPPIIAGMATMPGREKQVVKAIESIIPQVDELHVYANGYSNEPEWFRDIKGRETPHKMFLWLGDISEKYDAIHNPNPTTYLDRGDSGKFWGHYWNNELGNPHYYFSFDDDIIYPPGYVWKMIHYMQKHGNRPAVGIHAKVMKPENVNSYYHGSTLQSYHCRHALDRPRHANLLGTGTLGFFSGTISLSPEDFPLEYMNMADIHFGIKAQKLGIPMVALPRKKGYIKVQELPKGTTIYEKHHRNDALQTQRFNSIKWKLNKL